MGGNRKLSDIELEVAFLELAKGSSLRSVARRAGICHNSLMERLIRKYGHDQYKAALNRRSGTIPLLLDNISSLPPRRQQEAQQWLNSNFHKLLDLEPDLAHIPINNQLSSIYKVNLIESVPNPKIMPY